MLRRLLTFLVFSCSLYLSAQTQYYVSTNGDNNNSGTSIVQAWQTIQYAIDEVGVNSTVNILSGTYNEQISFNQSGLINQVITLTNYNSDQVVIDGSGLTAQKGIIEIYDYSYIHIVGLTIANNTQLDAQGIIIEGNCQGIEIIDNEIYNINYSLDPTLLPDTHRNAQPLIVYGTDEINAITDLVIKNNVIRDSRTGFSEGLAVNGNVDGFSVANNRVYNISNIGIDIIGHEETASSNDQARNGSINNNIVYNCKSPYATAAGIYVDGGKDLIIEFNRVFDCQWGIELGCENVGKTTSDIIVRSNFIYNNDDAGIAIGGFDYPTESGKVVDCNITNNTTYNNDKLLSGIGGMAGEVNISYTENCTLQNNIFYCGDAAPLLLYVDNVGSLNLNLDYNIYFGNVSAEIDYEGIAYANFTSYQSNVTQDANSSFENPIFRNLVNGDYHLSSSSPAINEGNPSYSSEFGSFDYDGDSRLLTGQIDVGADEYDACQNILSISGDIWSNSYSAIQEIQITGLVSKGAVVNLLAPEVIFTEPMIVQSSSVLSIINSPCP